MQDGHRTSINSASLTPDEVARRNFPTVRKGYDPTDVRMFLDRVGEQLITLYEREDDLRSRLARAEHRASNPEVDEAMLTAALGHETTRVLRSAHDAAADMKVKAEEVASQVIHEANEEAARIRAEGERSAAERANEAEVTAGRIRAAAATEADSILQAARDDAQASTERLQEDCRGMVREAQEVRARVLADLVRRRRALYGQVEHLRGGRQSLVEALREARMSFDHILETLQRDFDPGGSTQGQPELGTDEPVPGRAAPAASTTGVSPPGNPAAPAQDLADRAETPAPQSPETAPPGAAASGSSTAPQPPPPEPRETPESLDEPGHRRSLRIIRRTRPEATQAESAPEAPPVSAKVTGEQVTEGDLHIIAPPPGAETEEAEAGGGADAGPGERDPARASSQRDQEHASSGPVGTSPPPRRRGGGRHRASGSSAVDELFAKIKSGRSETGKGRRRPARGTAESEPATADAVDAEPAEATAQSEARSEPPPEPATETPPEGVPQVGDEAAPAEVPPSDQTAAAADAAASGPAVEVDDEAAGEEPARPEVSYLRRRDDAIAPITVALARRLKRALQDDHNDLLDRLRSGGKGEPGEILPPVAEHEERYRLVGSELLGQAGEAGTSFLRAWKGSEGPVGNDNGAKPGSSDLAGDLATSIVEPLRRRLARSLDESSDGDEASLVENVGSAYREWKGRRIERVVGDHVVAAFSLGELGVVRRGAALRWIVDDGDERCPDCDDNALAGPLPGGDRYPTGQAHPPAHSGCRCLLAPPPA